MDRHQIRLAYGIFRNLVQRSVFEFAAQEPIGELLCEYTGRWALRPIGLLGFTRRPRTEKHYRIAIHNLVGKYPRDFDHW